MLWVHFKCVLYVITMKSLGSFNQSSQCSQHVITGSRPPHPQCRVLRYFLQVCDRCAGKTQMSPCTAEWDIKHGKPIISCNLCISRSQTCSFLVKHWGINIWLSVRKMTPSEKAVRKGLLVARAPAIILRSISEGGTSSSPAPSSFQPPVAVDEGSQIVGLLFGGKGREGASKVSSFLIVCDYHYDDPFIFYYS